ncbi:MAG: hypothetical protein HOE90_13010 [Bacteriovoracaceae bacterium]|jgi:hypothetical protein|nr:hypothetical protein [Bacteriovoracaceae bacterium]
MRTTPFCLSAALSLIFILSFPNCFAGEPNKLMFKFVGDTKWELDSVARQEFNEFLEEQRVSLLGDIKELEFPAKFDSLKDAILSYAMPAGKYYKNRELSCLFLERVRKNLVSDADKVEFRGITKNGEICTQGDLAPSEYSAWTLRLVNFIWFQKWIPTSIGTKSMEQYLIDRLEVKNYIRPTINILTSKEYDAYGYSFSSDDMKTISQNKKLSEVFEITKNFTPNDASTFGDLGPEMKKMIEENTASAAGFFITEPSIYITNNWAPSDLIDLMAHEFGHVYHGLFKNSITDLGDVIEFKNSRIHDEGAAEAVAWFGLCKLYEDFPEIKFFHVFKLMTFSQLRKNDPHYVGAVSFANQFHYSCPDSSKELHQFLSAKSLDNFMEHIEYFPIRKIGKKDDEKVELVWEK